MTDIDPKVVEDEIKRARSKKALDLAVRRALCLQPIQQDEVEVEALEGKRKRELNVLVLKEEEKERETKLKREQEVEQQQQKRLLELEEEKNEILRKQAAQPASQIFIELDAVQAAPRIATWDKIQFKPTPSSPATTSVKKEETTTTPSKMSSLYPDWVDYKVKLNSKANAAAYVPYASIDKLRFRDVSLSGILFNPSYSVVFNS